MALTSNDLKAQVGEKTADVITGRLVDGESVLAISRIHKGIYWPALALLLFTLIIGYVFAYQLMYVLGGATLAMAVYAWLREKMLLLVVTNKRILARYGIIQVDLVDLRFDKVESMESEQMLTGYLMGYAKLVVMGTGNRYISIPYIANAAELRKKFNELVLED